MWQKGSRAANESMAIWHAPAKNNTLRNVMWQREEKLRETDAEMETKRGNGLIEEQSNSPLLVLSMVWK